MQESSEMFGSLPLDPNNEWIKLSKPVPWREFDLTEMLAWVNDRITGRKTDEDRHDDDDSNGGSPDDEDKEKAAGGSAP